MEVNNETLQVSRFFFKQIEFFLKKWKKLDYNF